MNISKNLLNLGLIVVISGISTAQTYTGTAGTNGITDIQSDYSMSTGDGASVSVDVPLEFELPKKVAIAVAPSGTKTLPALPEFSGITPFRNSLFSSEISTIPYNTTNHSAVGNKFLTVAGGIYANSSISVTADATDLIHELDPNSQIGMRRGVGLHKKDGTGINSLGYVYDNAADSSVPTLFPATLNVDDSVLASEGNQISFHMSFMTYLDTIDPTDRAGKYISTATITVSTL